MWIRFNQSLSSGQPQYGVVEVGEKEGNKMLKSGQATRCTGPDGIAFGESTAEDIEKQIKAEKNKK